jgi:hypothetical protein
VNAARPAVVALVGFVGASLFAIALVVVGGGAVSTLVHAAPPMTDPAAAPSWLHVQPRAEGFDGQFYLRTAARPLSTDTRELGVRLDVPSWRSQRAGYPLLARVVALGHDRWLPYSLVAVNVMLIGVLAGLSARLALDHRRSPWWGLVVAGYPGFVYSVAFDLTEPLAAALVLAAVLALERRRPWLAAAALTGAMFTRETSLVLALGVGAAWCWRRLRPRGAGEAKPAFVDLAPAVLPLVGFAVWQVVLRARFGTFALTANSSNNLGLPFAGLVSDVDRFVPTSWANLYRLVSLGLLVLLAVVAAASLRRSTAPASIRVAWLASVGFLALVTPYVWGGATSFMRAGAETWVLGVTVVLSAERLAAPVEALRRLVPVGWAGVLALTTASELAKAR